MVATAAKLHTQKKIPLLLIARALLSERMESSLSAPVAVNA
tara:strand:- start:760 stop:882 length:123 start_codon:yes stop_codon:yes gene_type:complete